MVSVSAERRSHPKSSKRKLGYGRRHKQTLVGLPDEIKSLICSFMGTKDLISLAEAIPGFQSHVTHALCSSIRLRIRESEQGVTPSYLHVHWKNINVRPQNMRETDVKSAHNLLMLVYNVLTNSKLGRSIRRISMDDGMDAELWSCKLPTFLSEEELKYISHSISFECRSLSLFDTLRLVLERAPNLRSLDARGLTVGQMNRLLPLLGSVEELTLKVSSDNREELRFNQHRFDRLTRLSLIFEPYCDGQLSQLSLELYVRGIMSRLTSLELRLTGTDFTDRAPESWVSFFDGIPRDETPAFASLTNLYFKNCQLGDQQQEKFALLQHLIPWDKIEELHLGIFEYSHRGRRHSDEDAEQTFLRLIAPRMASLNSLVLRPTRNCFICENNSTVDFLNSHKGLESISIYCNSKHKKGYVNLITALAANTSLHTISLVDEFINPMLIKNMKNWFVYDNLCPFAEFGRYVAEFIKEGENEKVDFDLYSSVEFSNFNEKNADALILFWRMMVANFKLDVLFKSATHPLKLKLFGFNFDVSTDDKLVMLYVGNIVGYRPLMYY